MMISFIADLPENLSAQRPATEKQLCLLNKFGGDKMSYGVMAYTDHNQIDLSNQGFKNMEPPQVIQLKDCFEQAINSKKDR